MKTRQFEMECLSALIYQYLEWEVDDNIIRGQFGNIWFLGYLILSALITTDDDPLENDDNCTCYKRWFACSMSLSNNSGGTQNEVSKSPNKFNGLCQMCKSLCRETSPTSDPVDAGHRRASPIKERSLRLAIKELACTNCMCEKSVFYILAFIIGQIAVYRMKEWVIRKMMVFNILNKDINKEITDGWDREDVRDMASGPQDEAVKKHKRCKSEPNIYTGTGIQKHLLRFCAENSLGSQNPANSIGHSNINCCPDIDSSTFANPLNNQKSTLSFKKPVLISVVNSLNSQDISVPSEGNPCLGESTTWQISNRDANIKAIQNSLSKTSTVGTENVYRKHIGTQTEIIINSYRNLLGGEWDRKKTFDENGGELRKARSAVTLVVPTGAINVKQVSTIYGKVFADLEKVSQVVKLWPNYRFISPVVEFISGGQTKYSKHLRIRMPIASKWNEKSSVICFPGRGDYSVSEVPTLSKNKQTLPDMYYEQGEDGFINIFTRHFTAFACVSCDRQIMSLNGIVFGCLKPLEVSLRLYLCDSLSAIPDILEPLREKEEKVFGRLLLDHKPIELEKPSPNDRLWVSIETSNKWKLKTKPDGSCLFPIHEKTLTDFHSCSSHQILYEWKYNSTLSKDVFGCCINAEAGKCRTTFDISIQADEERDTTRKSTGPFKEIKELLKRHSKLGLMREIARDLKVDETKMDDLRKNNKDDAAEEKHGIIELCVNKHGKSFPEELKATLKALHENHLLETIFPIVLKIETQV